MCLGEEDVNVATSAPCEMVREEQTSAAVGLGEEERKVSVTDEDVALEDLRL